MRLLIAAILGLVFITVPAAAQQGPNQHVFGTTTCRQKVPCPDADSSSAFSMSYSEMATAATSCLSQSLGLNNPDGFFEDSGLDSNNCLINKPSPAQNNSKNIAPQCCITKLPDNSCTFFCQLLSEAH